MAYLIRTVDNTLIGEIGIRSKYVPRIGETITIEKTAYLVEDVVYRNKVVRYELEYRIDIYVSDEGANIRPMIDVLQWDGIDEPRWVGIRKQLDELEEEEK